MRTKMFQNEQGTTMVEFAIIVVVLLSLVFGIIEFGVLLLNEHVLTNASREGARAAVVMRVPRLPDRYTHPVTGNNEGVIDVVENYCQTHLVTFGTTSSLNIAVEPIYADRKDLDSGTGTDLVVTVTYPFEFLFLSNLGLGPITLTAETRMEME